MNSNIRDIQYYFGEYYCLYKDSSIIIFSSYYYLSELKSTHTYVILYSLCVYVCNILCELSISFYILESWCIIICKCVDMLDYDEEYKELDTTKRYPFLGGHCNYTFEHLNPGYTL